MAVPSGVRKEAHLHHLQVHHPISDNMWGGGGGTYQAQLHHQPQQQATRPRHAPTAMPAPTSTSTPTPSSRQVMVPTITDGTTLAEAVLNGGEDAKAAVAGWLSTLAAKNDGRDFSCTPTRRRRRRPNQQTPVPAPAGTSPLAQPQMHPHHQMPHPSSSMAHHPHPHYLPGILPSTPRLVPIGLPLPPVPLPVPSSSSSSPASSSSSSSTPSPQRKRKSTAAKRGGGSDQVQGTIPNAGIRASRRSQSGASKSRRTNPEPRQDNITDREVASPSASATSRTTSSPNRSTQRTGANEPRSETSGPLSVGGVGLRTQQAPHPVLPRSPTSSGISHGMSTMASPAPHLYAGSMTGPSFHPGFYDQQHRSLVQFVQGHDEGLVNDHILSSSSYAAPQPPEAAFGSRSASLPATQMGSYTADLLQSDSMLTQFWPHPTATPTAPMTRAASWSDPASAATHSLHNQQQSLLARHPPQPSMQCRQPFPHNYGDPSSFAPQGFVPPASAEASRGGQDEWEGLMNTLRTRGSHQIEHAKRAVQQEYERAFDELLSRTETTLPQHSQPETKGSIGL